MTIQKLKIEQFNTAIRNAVARLDSDFARLKLTELQIAIIIALLGTDATAGSWCYYWILYAGGDATCTRNVIKAIDTLRDKLEKELSKILDDIPASVWNDDDRSYFMRTTGLDPTHTSSGEITDECLPAFTQYGGGKMKMACKSTHDQSRAKKAENSDGLQFNYDIVDQPTASETEDKKTVEVAASPETCAHRVFFSKATNTLELGIENSGRVLAFYVRWFNSKHPDKAGPWNGPLTKNIL